MNYRLHLCASVMMVALAACKSSSNKTTDTVDVTAPATMDTVQSPPTDQSLLIIDIWVLEKIDGAAIDEHDFTRERPRLEFNSEGRVTGTSGCNQISSTFTTEGLKIALGPMIATKMACPGNGESKFLTALKQVTDFRIEGLKLYLQAGGTEKLQFKKVD